MFFSKAAKIVAYLMFALGVLRVAMGFLLAFGTETMADNQAAASRYLSASSTGEAINEGTIAIVAAIVLGVLAEISSNIHRKAN